MSGMVRKRTYLLYILPTYWQAAERQQCLRSTEAATHPPRMQAAGQMEYAQAVPEDAAHATNPRDAAGPAAGGAVQTEEALVEYQENTHKDR